MRRSGRSLAIAVVALTAAAIAGCGVGEGETDPGTASLTVTRDFGAEQLLEANLEDPPRAESVVQFLDREAEIETSFGDNFVDSIEGVTARIEAGRSEDWFFYVNGSWSPIGAGEATVRAGDRIWWDYRDWTDGYRVPAVVGSWPEPFVHGATAEGLPTEVVCFDVEEACAEVAERLSAEGAEVRELAAGDSESDPERTLRVLVGSWAELRSDRLAADLEQGPGVSGVYGAPLRCDGGFGLEVLDDRAERRVLLTDASWVAALGEEDRQPTWVVTGSSADRVSEAVSLLEGEALTQRYAVAAAAGSEPQPLPAPEGSGVESPAGGKGCG